MLITELLPGKKYKSLSRKNEFKVMRYVSRFGVLGDEYKGGDYQETIENVLCKSGWEMDGRRDPSRSEQRLKIKEAGSEPTS